MADQKIKVGMLVKVGGSGTIVPITTMNPAGRIYEREKRLRIGQFLFGTVKELKERSALIEWAGPKYRTSTLPVEMLLPAINPAKRAKKAE